MIKKIASMLSFGKKGKGKIVLTKDDINTQNQLMVDEYVYRYPPFPKGIPTVPIETIINGNQEMIQQIILARGLAGNHNAKKAEIKILEPIRHLAEIVHLLPASEKNHFRTPGGLFRFSLESALFGIRYAERRILTRVTPEIRRENEALWTHAAFLTGLFSESILVISRISVYSEEGGIEWHPGMESIFQWMQRNKLKSYHIRWSEKEDRAMIYALAGKAIKPEQAEILAQGEKAIYKTLLSALHDQEDLNNPLVKINRSVKYKLIERDEAGDPSRYGKPLAGMHLDPWLIDAMRHLVEKKRWVVNEENGRLWHGKDGVYLVWPLAASDMQRELKESESPFVPNTKEILAELMQEAGIIESIGMGGGYLFDIAIPQSDSPEMKYVTAIRLVRHEILFEKVAYSPLDKNLRLHFEEEEEPNQETQKAVVNKEPDTSSEKNTEYSDDSDDAAPVESDKSASAPRKETDMEILFGKPDKSGDAGQDEIKGSSTSTKTEETRSEPCRTIEMDILFGRRVEPVETNQYDDEYASDYHNEQTVYAGSPEVTCADTDDPAHHIIKRPEETITPVSVINNAKNKNLSEPLSTDQESPEVLNNLDSKKTDNPKLTESVAELLTSARKSQKVFEKLDNTKKPSPKTAPKPSEAFKTAEKPSKKVNSPRETLLEVDEKHGNTTSVLLSELTETSKSQKKGKIKSTAGTTKADSNSAISKLFGNTNTQKNHDDLKSRSGIVLNRLKKLPIEFLESRPGGITKVIAKGLRNTNLNLRDCVSVLKAADLLVLVDGLETGMDSLGEKQSQYFLLKADLLDGK
ncbi:MobH family relaxase [Methylobacter tundripaludum]|jgi:conjugal transfer pilus assembly protein TraI|uniref:MobH family relaxase n=1 Tax=Methylobacter tundripaludum TaxID=173365 RepID=UPI0005650909|nr:MobH family relaxase [Methylobacter tundripaludum]